MFSLKSFFRKRCELIAKSKGLTRVFAYGEMVCFPVSLGVIAVVLAHALWTVAVPLLARVGVGLVAPVPLPAWFTSVFVAAAIGYLTNYVAIQMLYYPVSPDDLSGDEDDAWREREALSKSRILSLVTLGFWKKGLVPQNKGRIARQMGRIAEERFVTAENLSYLLSKFGALCVSKNAEGKVRGVEFIRRLAVAHKDEVADILRRIGRAVVTGGNYQTVRNLLAKVGRSETVAHALSAAIFDYMEKNPETVVSFVREMITGFTNAQTSKADRSGSLWEQIKAGATGFVVETVASIGYPQIRSFLEDYVRDPQHREQFRERLSSLLPIFCDKVAENIIADPQALSKFFSGDFVSELIHLDISDGAFWDMVGERVLPRVQGAIATALEAIPAEQFAGLFTGGHHIAGVVERTVMGMKLLDFYGMLDDMMAEHLGAIQVFGFVLGAAIGYVQYAVSLAGAGHPMRSCLVLGVPVLALAGVKVVRMFLPRRP